jgi:hypothetical protein
MPKELLMNKQRRKIPPRVRTSRKQNAGFLLFQKK